MKNFGKFAFIGAALALTTLVASSTARADAIPYPHQGTIVTSDDTLFASAASSSITYYGFNAGDTDFVKIIDVTAGTQSAFLFQNQTTPVGTQVALNVAAGDQLVVELFNQTTGSYFYSGTGNAPSGQPASKDGAIDHAYVTPFSGGLVGTTTVPAGLFIGMEDLGIGQGVDYDYNDDQFILTGVTTAPPGIPEPSSLMLLGTGLASAAGMMFRRRNVTA